MNEFYIFLIYCGIAVITAIFIYYLVCLDYKSKPFPKKVFNAWFDEQECGDLIFVCALIFPITYFFLFIILLSSISIGVAKWITRKIKKHLNIE